MDDFDRNVWCLLGLPFDAVTMDETIERIHHAVKMKEKCFISTPNLNFLIASQKDSEFRDSVINSELSVADGKPLIWLAKLLNIPLPERVAGSDIIERLIENKEGYKPIKVFFFGGQDGIAEQACNKLNTMNKGLKCVGFHNPGFGCIEQMSTPEIINSINQSGADFVIVSLGAKKGQAWIESNRNKLDAPVISHLGAVVNFIAGNVIRAPKLMQKLGLEWLWRIKEEPSLAKRYFSDGAALIKLFILRVIPNMYLAKKTNKNTELNAGMVEVNTINNLSTISMSGAIDKKQFNMINNEFINIINGDNSNSINVIINGDVYMDSLFLGKLLLLRKHFGGGKGEFNLNVSSDAAEKLLYYNCCEYLNT